MTGIKENGIKHCYRADKRNTLLEPSLKVLFIKFGWGATLKKSKDGRKMQKKENGCLNRQKKLIISASILLRKPCQILKPVIDSHVDLEI